MNEDSPPSSTNIQLSFNPSHCIDAVALDEPLSYTCNPAYLNVGVSAFTTTNASPIILAEPVTVFILPKEPVPLTDILSKFCVPLNVLSLFMYAILGSVTTEELIALEAEVALSACSACDADVAFCACEADVAESANKAESARDADTAVNADATLFTVISNVDASPLVKVIVASTY